MNEKPLTSIFSRVRDQYSAAVRWTYLAVILLLLIHLLTVGPFIELSREKSKTERENTRLSGVKSKIEGIGFKDLKASILTKLETQLTTFVNDLRRDFKRLDLTVEDLRKKAKTESELLPEKIKSMIPSDLREIHESILFASIRLGYLKSMYEIPETESELPEEAENQLREMLNSPKFRKSVESALKPKIIGMPLYKGPEGPVYVQSRTGGFVVVVEEHPFQITDPNLLKKIKFSEQRKELLEALKPFVEDNIIEPRYSELNEYWKTNLLPKIQTQFEELTNNMNTAESEFPEGHEEWEKLAKALEAIESAAGNIEFEQRTETPFWWSSEIGKEEVRIELKDKVTSQLKEPAVLTSLRKQVSQLLIEEEKLGQKIKEGLSKLDKQFQDQKDKLASIAKPLRFLALELESVMVILPLLLGLILAGATAWKTLRLRELGWTIHLMIKEGADQLLWDWYCAQVFLLLPKSSSNMTKQHNSSLIRKSLGLCAMSWIWIGITAWRLYGISEISPVRLVVVTCIGATVAALAQVHHYVVINSTLSLKGEQEASVATPSQE